MPNKITKLKRNRNTFSKVKVNHAKRKVDVEIGDSKQDEFLPQFKTKHWNNEANLSVRLLLDDYNGARVKESKGVVRWIKDGIVARFYDKDTGDEDGGFEFEVEYKKRPDTNVVKFSLQTKNLEFLYQPELTAEEIEAGRERPENVVGSYAVYHKANTDNYTNVQYRTGKAFHIYRPYAVDAKGEKVWCELNVDESKGEMSVTVPDDFLATAQYPVIVDPTFGYTSIGASSKTIASSGDDGGVGMRGTAITGELSSITSHIKLTATTGSGSIRMRLYSDTGTLPDAILADSGNVAISAVNPIVFQEFTQSLSYTLAGANYWATVLAGYNGTTTQVAYDTGSGDGAVASNFWATWNTDTDRNSVYATYTVPVVETDGDIAIYSDNIGGQNLNSATATDIDLPNEVIAEGGFSAVSDAEKNLPDARVLALYTITTQQDGGSNRSMLDVMFNYNGSAITTGRSSGYIRRSGHTKVAQTGMVILPAGASNTLKLQGQRTDNNTSVAQDMVVDQSALQLIQIGNLGAVYNAIANVSKSTAGIVTGAPATIANLLAGTWANVDWDIEAEVGSGYSTVGGAGGDEIIVPPEKILLNYGVRGFVNNASTRRNLVTRVQVRDGSGGSWVDVDSSFATGYLRGGSSVQNTNNAWSNWFGIIDLSGYSDPRVRVQFIEEAESGSVLCSYTSAYIQMIELPASAEYINLAQANADITSIVITPADVAFETTATELDSASFGHSTNVNVEMKKAEKYLFLAQFFADRSGIDTTRKEPQAIFDANGSMIPYARGSNYSRGDQSTTSTWFAGRACGVIHDNPTVDHVMKLTINDHATASANALEIQQERIALQGVNIPSLFATVNPDFETLQDNFNDNSLSAEWQDYNIAGGSVTETNQQIEVVSPSTGTGYTGFYAVNNWNMNDSHVSFELIEADIGTNHFFWFGVYTGGDYINIGIQNGNIIGNKNVSGGNTTVFTTTYVPATHRWLRMREASGTIYWEYSSDGYTWNAFYSEALAIDFSTCWCDIYIYSGGSQVATASYTLDNFNTQQASITKPMTYSVSTTPSPITKALKYVVQQITAITKSMKYTVATSSGVCEKAGWSGRTAITIPASNVDSALTDFVVAVKLSDMPAGWWSAVKSDGADIRVTTSDGSSEVPIHLATFDYGGNDGVLYFKASLSASVDNVFYIYAGNASATAYAVGDTYGQHNVYTSYEAVWQFNVDPSGSVPQVVDATGNGYDMNTQGSMTSGDLVDGVIDKAFDFDGVNDYLESASSHNTYAGASGEKEWVEWLMKSFGTPSASTQIIDFSGYHGIFIYNDGSWGYQSQGDNSGVNIVATEIDDGNPHHCVGYFDQANEYVLYKDGTQVLQKSTTDTEASNSVIRLANGISGADGRYYEGELDQIRWAKANLGADWAKAQSLNLLTPASFYTAGSFQSCASSGTPVLIQKDMTYSVSVTPSAVQKPLAYSVRSNTLIQKGLIYAVATLATIVKPLVYKVRSQSLIQLAMTYAVTSTASAITKSMGYAVRSVALIQKSMAYAVTAGSSVTKPLKYAVRSTQALQLPMTYTVTSPSAPITKSSTYRVRTSSQIQRTMAYAVISPDTVVKPMSYRIKSTQGQTKAMTYAVKVANLLQKSLRYVVGGGDNIQLPMAYKVISAVVNTLPMKYVVSLNSAIAKPMAYFVKTVHSQTKDMAYTVRTNALVQLGMSYAISLNTAVALPMAYKVRASKVVQKSMKYVVQSITAVQKPMAYMVKTSASIALAMKYAVTDMVAIALPMQYLVRSTNQIAKSMAYVVIRQTAITLPMRYVITRCHPYSRTDKPFTPTPSPYTAQAKPTTPTVSPYSYTLKPYRNIAKCD